MEGLCFRLWAGPLAGGVPGPQVDSEFWAAAPGLSAWWEAAGHPSLQQRQGAAVLGAGGRPRLSAH